MASNSPSTDKPDGGSRPLDRVVLPRCIERMERRREWIMEQKQRAIECNDMLKAAGWGLRAAGVADAIEILKVVEDEARQNAGAQRPATPEQTTA